MWPVLVIYYSSHFELVLCFSFEHFMFQLILILVKVLSILLCALVIFISFIKKIINLGLI